MTYEYYNISYQSIITSHLRAHLQWIISQSHYPSSSLPLSSPQSSQSFGSTGGKTLRFRFFSSSDFIWWAIAIFVRDALLHGARNAYWRHGRRLPGLWQGSGRVGRRRYHVFHAIWWVMCQWIKILKSKSLLINYPLSLLRAATS